jgi:hypothetical protein
VGAQAPGDGRTGKKKASFELKPSKAFVDIVL